MGRVENFVIRFGNIHYERKTVFITKNIIQSAFVFGTETAGFQFAGGSQGFLNLFYQIGITNPRTVDILAGSKDISGINEFADIIGNVQGTGVIEKEKNILHDSVGSLTEVLLAAGTDGADSYNPKQEDKSGYEKAFFAPEIFSGKPGNPCNDNG